MIDFSFTPEQIQFRQEIIDFARSHLNTGTKERNSQEQFDKSVWAKAGEMLIPGLAIPKQYGGAGHDIISLVSALEALGYGCEDNGLTFALGAHMLSCAVPVWLYGSEKQKEELLPNLCNGKWIMAHAMTEEGGGSDVFNMDTTASLTKDGFLLNGKKVFVSNAPVADRLLIHVLTNRDKGSAGGVSTFILNKGEFESSDKISKMGLRSCLMGNVTFNNTLVNHESVLSKIGSGMMIFNQSMIWERIGLSAIHIGTLQRLLENTIKVVEGNTSKRNKLSDHQVICHKLANIKAAVTGARWSVYNAAYSQKTKKDAMLNASIAKLQVSELYKESCIELLQIHGATGYLDNHEIQVSLRDATASTLYSGTSEIQRNLIYRYLKTQSI